MKIKTLLLIQILFLVLTQFICAQDYPQDYPMFIDTDAYSLEPDRLQLAISTIDYPVTPGDVYQLTYLSAGVPATYEIVVESDYNVEINIFGNINARDKTFPILKKEIEAKVSDAYPGSIPFVSIVSVGIFQVSIVGEVDRSSRITAWGLTHLSQAISGQLSSYSSVRKITIQSSNGQRKNYDLYKAMFEGDQNQDPLLKPEDKIEIIKSEKDIEIIGQVHRPGRYQVFTNDTMELIIDYYGRGFTEDANLNRIKITHNTLDNYEILYLNSEDDNFLQYRPEDGDLVEVFSVSRLKEVIYIEGAISPEEIVIPDNEEETTDELAPILNEVNRITFSFNPGITLYDALQSNLSRISTYADLKAVYIVEQSSDEPIYIDCEDLLYQYSSEKDRELNPFDIIVIPEISFRVNVVGAVYSPGVYPFIRGKGAMHYINQAGGIDPDQNANYEYRVRNSFGDYRIKDQPIEAGDTIIVPFNSFTYNFEHYSDVITTSLALITAIITFVNLIASQ